MSYSTGSIFVTTVHIFSAILAVARGGVSTVCRAPFRRRAPRNGEGPLPAGPSKALLSHSSHLLPLAHPHRHPPHHSAHPVRDADTGNPHPQDRPRPDHRLHRDGSHPSPGFRGHEGPPERASSSEPRACGHRGVFGDLGDAPVKGRAMEPEALAAASAEAKTFLGASPGNVLKA